MGKRFFAKGKQGAVVFDLLFCYFRAKNVKFEVGETFELTHQFFDAILCQINGDMTLVGR